MREKKNKTKRGRERGDINIDKKRGDGRERERREIERD